MRLAVLTMLGTVSFWVASDTSSHKTVRLVPQQEATSVYGGLCGVWATGTFPQCAAAHVLAPPEDACQVENSTCTKDSPQGFAVERLQGFYGFLQQCSDEPNCFFPAVDTTRQCF